MPAMKRLVILLVLAFAPVAAAESSNTSSIAQVMVVEPGHPSYKNFHGAVWLEVDKAEYNYRWGGAHCGGKDLSENSIQLLFAAFRSEYRVTLERVLELRLVVVNTGDVAFEFEEALHSYFAVADVRESVAPDQHTVPVSLRDPYHQPHLQNFFDTVRGKATLNCPAEIGYESAVSVLKVNEAIEAKSRLAFKPEDFKI